MWTCCSVGIRKRCKVKDKDNPAEDIILPKNVIKRKAKKPTDGVVKLIRKILRRFNDSDDDLLLYYELGFRLGMRKGELLGLPFSAIDLEKMQIHVCQDIVRDENYKSSILKDTKTEGSNRIIPIPICLKEKLIAKIARTRRITNRVAESCIIAKTDNFKPQTDLLLIKVADGKPYFSNSPTRKLKKMLEVIKADKEFEIDKEMEELFWSVMI